jgi:hypothetical protein
MHFVPRTIENTLNIKVSKFIHKSQLKQLTFELKISDKPIYFSFAPSNSFLCGLMIVEFHYLTSCFIRMNN